MAKEFQKFRLHFRRSAGEILFSQGVEQPRLRLIGEPICSWPGDCTGVKIFIGQLRRARAYLAQQASVAIQGCVEARFEHSFRLRRRGSELKRLQGPELGKDSGKECKKPFATRGRLVGPSPILVVA